MIEMINQNPKGGTIGAIVSFLIGMLPAVSPEMQGLIIFYFQIAAFTISIAVGILTILSYARKARERRQKTNEL